MCKKGSQWVKLVKNVYKLKNVNVLRKCGKKGGGRVGGKLGLHKNQLTQVWLENLGQRGWVKREGSQKVDKQVG